MIHKSALLLAAAPIALVSANAFAQVVAPTQVMAEVDQAQRADPSDPAATPDGDDIIVVGTAGAGTRRQDAAFAVTTLSNADIERAAPTSTADLLRGIPGVSAESSGGQNGANIFVRGYPSGGDAQFVTFQSSGVPIFPPPTLSFLENSQLIQLDETVARVEAVRGGTGSLFSSGQPGLTVNVVQREGGRELSGLAKVSYTDYGVVRGDAYVAGPLGEDTSFMVGGFYAQGNGIRDPQFRAEKGGQVTANIRHDFGSRGSVLIYGRYLNDHGQWLLPIPIVQNGRSISSYPGFDAGTGALASREIQVTTLNDGRTVNLADGRGAKVINTGINFDYELTDGLRLRERTSFLGGSADTVGLVPAGPPTSAANFAIGVGGAGSTIGSLTYVNGGAAVANAANQQVIQAGIWDVRKKISSFVTDTSLEFERGGNKLTGGFYYATFDTRDNWNLGNGLLLTAEENARRLDLTLADGRIATRDGFAQGSFYNLRASYTGEDVAFYAVDELKIGDKLRLDGGIRWQQHRVNGAVFQPSSADLDNNPSTLYNNGNSVPGSVRSSISYKDDRFSFTAGADYEFTRTLGAFARFSRGHSFPQFDNLRESVTDIARVDTYEGGLKLSTSFLNLYATVFHNEFTGLATIQIINNVQTSSIGGAKATGVELEGVLRPFTGFSITGSGTYLDSTYQDFFSGNGMIDNTGNRVQRQPRWGYRVTPAYEVTIGKIKPSAFATLQYTGDRFSDPENNQLLPHFYQLDAGAAVELSEQLRLQVTANNLTNEIGLTEGNPRIIGSQGAGPILARPILGRSFTFSAQVKF